MKKQLFVLAGVFCGFATTASWAADNFDWSSCYRAASQCASGQETYYNFNPTPVAVGSSEGRNGFFVFSQDGSGDAQFYELPSGKGYDARQVYRIDNYSVIRYTNRTPDLQPQPLAFDSSDVVHLLPHGEKENDGTRSRYWKLVKERYDDCAATAPDQKFTTAIDQVLKGNLTIPPSEYQKAAQACVSLFPAPQQASTGRMIAGSSDTQSGSRGYGNAN
jgi:hypothetical protein